MYYARVMRGVFRSLGRRQSGYRQFNSYIDDFYEHFGDYRVTSVNNHALDLDRLGDFRISRFVRDPRDLVVSGYFYHKRGAEEWCNIVDPSPEDWRVVNGNFPQGMGAGHSLSSYLQSLNQEEGLLAEIEFRRNHLQSMRDWPQDDSRIRVYRYEEIMGNEEDVFANIAELYGLPLPHRKLARFFANKYSAKKRTGRTQHIRNPSPGQWQNVFTPRVSTFFREQYGDLLERYGYA